MYNMFNQICNLKPTTKVIIKSGVVKYLIVFND